MHWFSKQVTNFFDVGIQKHVKKIEQKWKFYRKVNKSVWNMGKIYLIYMYKYFLIKKNYLMLLMVVTELSSTSKVFPIT